MSGCAGPWPLVLSGCAKDRQPLVLAVPRACPSPGFAGDSRGRLGARAIWRSQREILDLNLS